MKRRVMLMATVAMLAQAGRLQAAPLQADFGTVKVPAAVRRLANWVVRSRDHGARDFAMLDKRQARLYVFGGDGRLRAQSAVLLGFARGDHSAPGIGDKPLSQVRPDERTTPAGRFELEAGRNLKGEDILWVDYDAAVSLHRVRATVAAERRLERLGTPTSADNRISFGCINVPPEFFDTVMKPAFGSTVRGARGVLYILPEVLELAEVFPMAASPSQGY